MFIIAALNEVSGYITNNVAGTPAPAGENQQPVVIEELPPQLQKLYADHGQNWTLMQDDQGSVTVAIKDKIIGTGRSSIMSPYHDAVATALFEALDYATYGSMFAKAAYAEDGFGAEQTSAGAKEADASGAENTVNATLLAIAAVERDGGNGDGGETISKGDTDALAAFDSLTLKDTPLSAEQKTAQDKLMAQAMEAVAEHGLTIAHLPDDEGNPNALIQICQIQVDDAGVRRTVPLSETLETEGLDRLTLAKLLIGTAAALEIGTELHYGDTPVLQTDREEDTPELKEAA